MRGKTLCLLAMAVVCVAATAQADYVSAVLADNPFEYYRMQELNVVNGTAADNSGATGVDGSYSVTGGSFTDVTSAVPELNPGKGFTATSGTTGTSIDLVPQGSDYAALDDFTFEFLLKPGAADPNYQAIYTSAWGTNKVHLNLLDTTVYMNGETGVDIATEMATGQWIHMAIAHDSSGASKYYVNGELLTTCTSGLGHSTIDFNQNAAIGRWLDSWTGDNRYYKGQMDEFAVYATALDAETIAGHAALVPEPGSLALLLAGLLGLLAYAWRKRR